MDHKSVNVVTVNGYPYVRRLRQRGSEHRVQRSPATTRKVAGEPASRTHGKPRGKDVVNLVNDSRRNAGDFDIYKRLTPEPKWHAACRRCFPLTAVSSYMQPGDSVSLKVLLNVDGGELGHPVVPRENIRGIHNVSEGEGTVGVGHRRKRMPFCSETDRKKLACDKYFRPKGSPLPMGLFGRETLERENAR